MMGTDPVIWGRIRNMIAIASRMAAESEDTFIFIAGKSFELSSGSVCSCRAWHSQDNFSYLYMVGKGYICLQMADAMMSCDEIVCSVLMWFAVLV